MTVKVIQARISERGEILLPAEVLQILGVGPNDRVEIAIDEDEVRILAGGGVEESRRPNKANSERSARRRAALLPISRAFTHESVEEAEQAVAAAIAEVRAEARMRRTDSEADT